MTARARTWTNVTREPVDDVWLTAHHKIKHYSISEAIEMHRETHHPTIYNMPDAPLYMSLELNMNLEKVLHLLLFM